MSRKSMRRRRGGARTKQTSKRRKKTVGHKRPTAPEPQTKKSKPVATIRVVVARSDGELLDSKYLKDATVGDVKLRLSQRWGLRREHQRLYLDHDERETDLQNDNEKLREMRRRASHDKELITMSVLIEMPDAQVVVPGLPKQPTAVLGTGKAGTGRDDQFDHPEGVAWVPSKPDWLITTEAGGHRLKVTDVRTGAMVCKFGQEGAGDGQFQHPKGVAITADSAYVVVADSGNDRLQVLELVIAAGGQGAQLKFVRCIGEAGHKEGQITFPTGVALLDGDGTEQTVLVCENHRRVSKFALDGTFIRIFAGILRDPRELYDAHAFFPQNATDGELYEPLGIAVLDSSSGEEKVVIADTFNHRVQVFDRHGTFLRKFGIGHPGRKSEADGKFHYVVSLASDARGNILVVDRTKRLQLFNSKGEHLCTRRTLLANHDHVPLRRGSLSGTLVTRALAWGARGQLAVADRELNHVRVWYDAQSVGAEREEYEREEREEEARRQREEEVEERELQERRRQRRRFEQLQMEEAARRARQRDIEREIERARSPPPRSEEDLERAAWDILYDIGIGWPEEDERKKR